MMMRAAAGGVLGATGAGMGSLFIVLSAGDWSGWATWPGRLLLVGLGVSSVFGMAGAFVASRHPLIGALVLGFLGAALIVLPIYVFALLFLAAGMCLIDALGDRRRATRC